MQDYSLIMLAAGKGTRMKSKKQKVLHTIAGKSMIKHVIDSVNPLPVKEKIVIIGHQSEQIKAEFDDPQITFAKQEKQLGTGHALLQAREVVKTNKGSLLVLPSDIPLIHSEVLVDFVQFHANNHFKVSVLSTEYEDPSGYGRIIRDEANHLVRIVEEEDARDWEKDLTEVNTGVYCFTNDDHLWEFLELIEADNQQGEFYLPDVIPIYREKGYEIGVLKIDDGISLKGVNTREELAEAEKIFNERKIRDLMDSGVTITDPSATYIDKDSKVGMDTIILPFTHIKGETRIGENCIIGPNSWLIDSIVGSDSTVSYSVVEGSMIRANCSVGPFSHLRPGADIGPKVSIGNYVEVKESRLKEGTKVNHLTYIGDSQIGKKVNVGAGTITCNYDGKRKHKTTIGASSFIGSNVSLVAPITIGKKAVVGAGSTLTKDVPPRALAIARKRQVNIKNWKRRGENRKDG